MIDYYTFDSNGDEIEDAMSVIDDNSLIFLYDTNLDGNYDHIESALDFDSYGNPSSYMVLDDTDHNGIIDTAMGYYDSDGDGYLESFIQMFDYDQDGTPDSVKAFVDLTGDGEANMVINSHSDNSESEILQTTDVYVDIDNDHNPDYVYKEQSIDTTGDGFADKTLVWESQNGVDFEKEPIVLEHNSSHNFSTQFGFEAPEYATSVYNSSYQDTNNFDPSTPDEYVSGNPASDMENWEYQGDTGRCAIYSQKFVIEQLTGQEIDIEDLVAVAEENGWFDESEGGGTATLNMDKLLNYYNVENQMSFDNDLSDLEKELNEGKKVIVGLDSGQIWYGEENNIFSPETTADHAVEVIGIDRSDENNPMVILNDSGTPEGKGEMVPLEIFENAWTAGDSQMVVCWT